MHVHQALLKVKEITIPFHKRYIYMVSHINIIHRLNLNLFLYRQQLVVTVVTHDFSEGNKHQQRNHSQLTAKRRIHQKAPYHPTMLMLPFHIL